MEKNAGRARGRGRQIRERDRQGRVRQGYRWNIKWNINAM